LQDFSYNLVTQIKTETSHYDDFNYHHRSHDLKKTISELKKHGFKIIEANTIKDDDFNFLNIEAIK